MDPNEIIKDQDFVDWVAGTLVIKDSIPISHRYGGYQFGHWVCELLLMVYFFQNFEFDSDFYYKSNSYLRVNFFGKNF